jgi:hypothetical protein
MWYHSSEDTPDKQDSTQYKRAAAVGLGSLAALASGTDEMAARILQENIGRGLARMGESHTKGLGYLADVTDPSRLNGAWREAEVAVRHQAAIEKQVIESASVLYTDTAKGKTRTAAFVPLIDSRLSALLEEIRAAYALQAAQRGVTAPAAAGPTARKGSAKTSAGRPEPALTAEEREAANLIVTVAPGDPAASGRGAAGGRGGAGGGGRGAGRGGPSLPTELNAEFNNILGRKMTVLEIRDFLSGQFSPVAVGDVMTVLKAREAAGSIKLVQKVASR